MSFDTGGVNCVVGRECAAVIQRRIPGFDPKDKRGWGSSGCVLGAGPGEVVKITWDSKDAFLSWDLMRTGSPPEFPRILGVYHVPTGHSCLESVVARDSDYEDANFYVIHREDLAHLDCEDVKAVSALLTALEQYDKTPPWWATAKYNSRPEDAKIGRMLFVPEGLVSAWEFTDYRDYHRWMAATMKATYATLIPDDRKIIDAYLRARRWATRRGWVLGDIRRANLGLREATGEVVVRDYGETNKRRGGNFWYEPKDGAVGTRLDGMRRRRR